METAKLVVNSMVYENLINEIQKKIILKIIPDYRDSAAERDSQKMDFLSITSIEAIGFLEKNKEDVVKFAILKMQKFENVKTVEEYPKGEEPNDGDVDDNETILGYSKGFLLMYLLEFYLLKNQINKLEEYLKMARIPYAKKYEKELKEIYKKI